MNVNQAIEMRLSEIRDLVESGYTEHTGRAMKSDREESGGYSEATGKRFRGLKRDYPELLKLKWDPSTIAAVLRRHPGRLSFNSKDRIYNEIVKVVADQMLREGFKPPRPAPGLASRTVGPHDPVRPYCGRCREFHTPGQHRFHGVGSFHRTHLFSFGGNPTMKGRGFTFHGSFTSKILAARREKEIPGSFIHPKNGRYYVLKPKKILSTTKNPAGAGRRVLTFKHLPPNAVFEFSTGALPRGPWRKVSSTRFQLASGEGAAYEVNQSAPVRTVSRGLFAEGPLFQNKPKKVFARLMQKAQVGQLTTRERLQLQAARRALHRPRETKRRQARPNPAGGKPNRWIRMGRLVEIRYQRDHGTKPGFYKHPFTQRPDVFFNPALNRIIVKGGR